MICLTGAFKKLSQNCILQIFVFLKFYMNTRKQSEIFHHIFSTLVLNIDDINRISIHIFHCHIGSIKLIFKLFEKDKSFMIEKHGY